MSSYGVQAGMVAAAGPSLDLDLDLLPGSSSSSIIPSTYNHHQHHQTMSFSDMDKSLMVDIAGNAMNELIRLLQSNDPLWIKSTSTSSSSSSTSSGEILNLEAYDRIFPRPNNIQLKNPNVRIESSRASGVVIMNGLALVDMLMDAVIRFCFLLQHYYFGYFFMSLFIIYIYITAE